MNVLLQGDVIVGIGAANFQPGPGQTVVQVDGDLPPDAMTHYTVVDGALVLRMEPLTVEDAQAAALTTAEKRERIKARIGELILKRLVLGELGKDLTDINAKVNDLVARFQAL